MAYASSRTPRLTRRWYKDDPMAVGNGLGVVLHERRRRWVVADVLSQSPAEKAALRPGDVVLSVGDYDLEGGDGAELLRLLRTARARKRHAITLQRKGEGLVTVQVTPVSMLRILDTHRRLNGGFGDVSMCRTCKLCLPSIGGFAECGLDGTDPITGRRCRFPCMIA